MNFSNKINIIANNIVSNSLKAKKGQSFLIVAPIEAKELVIKIIEKIYSKGAYPFVKYTDTQTNRAILKGNSKDRMQIAHDNSVFEWNKLDGECRIMLTGDDYEYSDRKILDKIKESSKINKKLNDEIINNKKWVLLEWPSEVGAYKSKMSLDDYKKFVFDVSSIDYKKMYEYCIPLKNLMDKTDKVKITGKGTDINFSIKDIPSVICAGEYNIPDGEVFTAPVLESVNGYITYNCLSSYHGEVFQDIFLEFKNGKIVNQDCKVGDKSKLKSIFDTDKGARYIGEFALGLNPKVNRVTGSILFDEKIAGSFHFTPGQCYTGEADNGNNSLIHWDLVCLQDLKNGGGEIYFDGVLIRKNGKFVLKELESLNF